MAKRKAAKSRKRSIPVRRVPTKARPARRAVRRARRPAAKQAAKATKSSIKVPKRAARRPAKTPRLERQRRMLPDEVAQTPPSSLDLERHGTAARSGRADIAHQRRMHTGMPESITGGDVDVDVEDAYFTGDEAAGGDNPSPDLEVVDDIGRALGVQYEDTEELKGSEKIVERDKHRWEYDPASAEDYKERK
ncbi:MAG: DUF6335 family protein [Acidobacteriia bacterium]|nr:DUF6335 family protein [Terriglobia bacterium]